MRPQQILEIAKRLFLRKGLIRRRRQGTPFVQGPPTIPNVGYVAGRVTFDVLPDDVLLDILDFYGFDSESSCYPWRWHTLVHVCRRWRQIIFASPLRLDLQFVCTPRTRVRELLDFLPPSMPIMIRYSFDGTPRSCSTLSLEDESQVIAALEQRDDMYHIQLEDLSNSLLEKLATAMQETFSTLTHVELSASDETAPVLPKEFLGGSAPCLERFWLKGIPFPDVPQLLLSANRLIHVHLEKIPDSGYFSPEAMVTALSTCTSLEALFIEFLGNPRPNVISQEVTWLTPISLPALATFVFEGHSKYFHNLFFRIDNPLFALIGNHLDMNKRVHYETFLTPSGFSFRYWDICLMDPVPVEE
jgi:hypothetical protein